MSGKRHEEPVRRQQLKRSNGHRTELGGGRRPDHHQDWKGELTPRLHSNSAEEQGGTVRRKEREALREVLTRGCRRLELEQPSMMEAKRPAAPNT